VVSTVSHLKIEDSYHSSITQSCGITHSKLLHHRSKRITHAAALNKPTSHDCMLLPPPPTRRRPLLRHRRRHHNPVMIGPQFLLTTMRIRPMRVRLQAQLLIPLARANRANRAQLHVASGLAVAVRLLAVAARVVGGFGAEGVDQDGEGGTAADDYRWVGG
tara:strand:- start:7272 stop:7754 length:483 start_codon:yes stop_codon:yes gene_type:complete